MLVPQDIGHRVVVRRVVGIRHGRPVFSDTIGELTRLTDSHLTVATARGTVTVARDRVVAAKRIPPRGPDRRPRRNMPDKREID